MVQGVLVRRDPAMRCTGTVWLLDDLCSPSRRVRMARKLLAFYIYNIYELQEIVFSLLNKANKHNFHWCSFKNDVTLLWDVKILSLEGIREIIGLTVCVIKGFVNSNLIRNFYIIISFQNWLILVEVRTNVNMDTSVMYKIKTKYRRDKI